MESTRRVLPRAPLARGSGRGARRRERGGTSTAPADGYATGEQAYSALRYASWVAGHEPAELPRGAAVAHGARPADLLAVCGDAARSDTAGRLPRARCGAAPANRARGPADGAELPRHAGTRPAGEILMPDLTRYIAPGAGVWWSQASAEPTPLVHALLDQAEIPAPLRVFCGITLDERLTGAAPAGASVCSYGALGRLRALSQAGRLEVVPCHYSTLPRLFAEHLLPRDVGLVQVSPPDATGACSLGTGVDYAATPWPTPRSSSPRSTGACPPPPAGHASRWSGSPPTSRPTGRWASCPAAPPTRPMWRSPATSPSSSTTAPRSRSGSAPSPPPCSMLSPITGISACTPASSPTGCSGWPSRAWQPGATRRSTPASSSPGWHWEARSSTRACPSFPPASAPRATPTTRGYWRAYPRSCR